MSSDSCYTFQQLTIADVARFKELLHVFGDAFADRETYQRSIPSDAYLARLLAKSDFIVVVALRDDEVIGGLVAYELEKFEQDRREIYIYDLAVLDGHRRQGVATGLINALRAVAAHHNAYVIFVQADLEDAPAIALYESLGTIESVYHFDITVPK